LKKTQMRCRLNAEYKGTSVSGVAAGNNFLRSKRGGAHSRKKKTICRLKRVPKGESPEQLWRGETGMGVASNRENQSCPWKLCLSVSWGKRGKQLEKIDRRGKSKPGG